MFQKVKRESLARGLFKSGTNSRESNGVLVKLMRKANPWKRAQINEMQVMPDSRPLQLCAKFNLDPIPNERNSPSYTKQQAFEDPCRRFHTSKRWQVLS